MSSARASAVFSSDLQKIIMRTDRLFFWLLIAQWIGAVVVALLWSPRTWIAEYWSLHQHVSAAAVLGGLFGSLPLFLLWRHRRRGEASSLHTRHMLAIGQMLQSALLVHVTGGRIETHFHVFGSLALLAFYRDWSLIITAGLTVWADHIALGIWFPLSVYGVPAASIWRSVEHAFWVVFEGVFLALSCRKGKQELWMIAERQAKVEQISATLQQVNSTLEERVRERTDKLARANQHLQEYAREIQRVNEELNDFTYIVSHDLKEPLRSLEAFSKFLVQDYAEKLDAEGRDYLERVRANAIRMQRLIDDLLEVSRLSRRANEWERVDIRTLLEEVQLRFEYLMKEKRVRLAVRGALPVVVGDRTRLAEVFANLLSNAIKYNDKPQCQVEIRSHAVEGGYQFSVSDNGSGIEPQYFKKIFEIFQRLGKREGQEGTGVGLTIVKKIVELHKGDVWVESRKGEGATFHFTLPADEALLREGLQNGATQGAATSQEMCPSVGGE